MAMATINTYPIRPAPSAAPLPFNNTGPVPQALKTAYRNILRDWDKMTQDKDSKLAYPGHNT